MQTTSGTSLNDVTPSAPTRRGLLLLLSVVAAAVYAVDQITKILAVARLTPGRPHSLIGDLLQLHLIRNAGAAFSVATGDGPPQICERLGPHALLRTDRLITTGDVLAELQAGRSRLTGLLASGRIRLASRLYGGSSLTTLLARAMRQNT